MGLETLKTHARRTSVPLLSWKIIGKLGEKLLRCLPVAVAVALGSHFSVESDGWIFTSSWFGDLPSRRLELLTIHPTWMADDGAWF